MLENVKIIKTLLSKPFKVISKRYYLTLSLLSASFLRKNETILLENVSNLTHEFLYDNFNKEFFLLKLSYKNSCVKLDAFSRRNG